MRFTTAGWAALCRPRALASAYSRSPFPERGFRGRGSLEDWSLTHTVLQNNRNPDGVPTASAATPGRLVLLVERRRRQICDGTRDCASAAMPRSAERGDPGQHSSRVQHRGTRRRDAQQIYRRPVGRQTLPRPAAGKPLGPVVLRRRFWWALSMRPRLMPRNFVLVEHAMQFVPRVVQRPRRASYLWGNRIVSPHIRMYRCAQRDAISS